MSPWTPMPYPKKLIERAYRMGSALGLAVWCQDEAGPFQTQPYPGPHWVPLGQPAHYPHEYVRRGTAKMLTLFHPATGQVRVKGVTSCPNAVLHGWLKEELGATVVALPSICAPLGVEENRALWENWREGLAVRATLPQDLPPLRMLLVLDNLAGHKTRALLCWLCTHGNLPLYTPLGGSWLNMAESIQRILKRRALDGQHPRTPRRSSAGLRRPRADGTAIQRRSYRVDAARRGGSARVTAVMPSAGPAPVRNNHFTPRVPHVRNGYAHDKRPTSSLSRPKLAVPT